MLTVLKGHPRRLYYHVIISILVDGKKAELAGAYDSRLIQAFLAIEGTPFLPLSH